MLIQSPARCRLPPSPLGAAVLSHNLDDAVCLSLFEGQVQGLGVRPTSFPHRRKTSTAREKKYN